MNRTITLAVDLVNNGTLVNQTFTETQTSLDKVVYTSSDHTLVSRDQVALARSWPKRVGVFYGVAKSSVKFTKDVTVAQADGTTAVAPIIMELSASVPVGANASDVLAMRQRIVAITDNDAVIGPLHVKLMV